MPWTPGPVFQYECLRAARRWQTYALRSLFVAALLAVVAWVWWKYVGPFEVLTHGLVSRMGQPLYYGIVGTQLAVVLLAAPATSAGAICLDRARGTLVHLLVTDVSAAEIVLGKLAAALIRVLSLILLSLPVLALSILLGGIDPEAVLGAYLVTIGVAVLGCSLALTLSVWGRRTHEVLLVNYFVWLAVLLIYPAYLMASWVGLGPVPDWAEYTNPFWVVFAPYAVPGLSYLGGQALVLGVCLGASALLVLLAVLRLRPVVLRELSRGSTPARAPWRPGRFPWLRGRPGDNPVLWLATRRVRVSVWLTVVWFLYLILAVGFSSIAVLTRRPSIGIRGGMPGLVNAFQVSIGLLFVGILAVSKLAEERTRGTLDLLLGTPLTAREIVWGYWWGAFRPVLPLLLLPVAVSELSAHGSVRGIGTLLLVVLVLSCGAALASLGVGLAVWLNRAGRAITVVVVVYALVAAGWVAVVMNTFSPEPYGVPVIMASPWFGALALTGDEAQGWGGAAFSGGVLWSLVYLASAWGGFELTVARFDRKLRTSGRSVRGSKARLTPAAGRTSSGPPP